MSPWQPIYLVVSPNKNHKGGGALGLTTGLPARIVYSAFVEGPSTQYLWKVPV